MESDADLIEQVNESGFPFQLRVKEEIEQSHTRTWQDGGHNWEVWSTEQSWTNPETKGTGYIDIVLTQPTMLPRLILECKRVKDANWLFHVEPQSERDVMRVRILSHETPPGSKEFIAWHDERWLPKSYESSICILWRAKKNDPSLLEKIASNLIDSVECLAEEENKLRIARRTVPDSQYILQNTIYIPVLVTNAELRACVFDPKDVNLDRGELSASDVQFEPIPYIRFRKPIPSRYDAVAQIGRDPRDTNLCRERTVFVVQVSHLAEFLRQCWVASR